VATGIPSQLTKVINGDYAVQVLAETVTSLLTAYRKNVVDVNHSNDGNRPRLD